MAYVGEFCRPVKIEIIPPPSPSSRATPIALGIVSGIAGLLLVTAIVLTIVVVRRRRSKPNAGDSTQLFPRDYLEPLDISAEKIQVYMNTMEPNLDQERFDESFFADLDQQRAENAYLTGSASDEHILTYDPIYELDRIIDNEDISMTFHDAIDDNHPIQASTPLAFIQPDSYVVRSCPEPYPLSPLSRRSRTDHHPATLVALLVIDKKKKERTRYPCFCFVHATLADMFEFEQVIHNEG